MADTNRTLALTRLPAISRFVHLMAMGDTWRGRLCCEKRFGNVRWIPKALLVHSWHKREWEKGKNHANHFQSNDDDEHSFDAWNERIEKRVKQYDECTKARFVVRYCHFFFCPKSHLNTQSNVMLIIIKNETYVQCTYIRMNKNIKLTS